jgi:tetratricopeptide (TPR) repeat protein
MGKIAIQGLTNEEWEEVKKIIDPVLTAFRPGRTLTERAILRLRQAAEQQPDEWMYWYALGDWCQRLDDWENSIDACRRCYELRPNDPRSAYALATAYRFWADEHSQSGLAVEDAAREAVKLFQEVLDAPIPRRQRFMVRRHLAAMFKKYPELHQANAGE